MIITIKREDKTNLPKNSLPKKKQQTPTKIKQQTVPKNTLLDDQCRYCNDTGHKASDCPKFAARRKMGEDPNAARCTHCNAPGHKEPICYFGANMENRPPKWPLTETQSSSAKVINFPKNIYFQKHPELNLHHRRI